MIPREIQFSLSCSGSHPAFWGSAADVSLVGTLLTRFQPNQFPVKSIVTEETRENPTSRFSKSSQRGGKLLRVRWVFLRVRTLNVFILKNEIVPSLVQLTYLGVNLSWKWDSGLLESFRTWRFTSRRIWGCSVSSLLLLKSRWIRSTRFENTWLGIFSILLWLRFNTIVHLAYSRLAGTSLSELRLKSIIVRSFIRKISVGIPEVLI